MNVPIAGAGAGPPSPWFLGAPVSKFVTFSTIISFVVVEMTKSHNTIAFDMDKVINDGQVYRLFLCHLTFRTIGELIFGLGALTPLMRRFEREMGSRKFGTFLLFTMTISTAWEVMLSQIFHDFVRYSGPYPLIGSFLLLFHMYTPRLHPRFFGVLGFDVSEKALTYALAFQVLFYGRLGTMLPAFCGALAGYLSVSPVLPLSKWELPDFVYGICEACGSGFVDRPPLIMARRHGGGVGRGGGGGGMGGGGMGQRQRLVPDGRFGGVGGGGGMAPPPPGGAAARNGAPPPGATQQPFQNLPPPSPPPEEAIATLTSMGFDREAVVRVLGQCDNNVEVAANRLLSGG